MEEALSTDTRFKNAKIRMQERGEDIQWDGKRRRLKHIENQAMVV